ncbi:peroxisomal membrane protein PEX16-like [Physella acuta]|uniref:peroxisomal membrane protein PEX16-like n=1 Tax=Physella acuta TaxID=109671 RepID=UPI0027DE531D|nr:peroxisomal membrane protein PEX16-like [Physella acuta]
MTDILQNLYQEYKNAISNNYTAIAQFESAFRLVSYVIAGRFEDSTILSELLYSASNLLILFNDAIIKKASGILPKVSASQERLQSLVTILEYVGVFIEITAQRLYGDIGKWVAITVLQIAKSVCRFLLFVKHEVGIQAVPPLSPIDREAILKEAVAQKQNQPTLEDEPALQQTSSAKNGSVPSVTFTLKRSGKYMRSLTAAPPMKLRDWKLPEPPLCTTKTLRENHKPTKLSRSQAWGECLYIFKPLIHLTSLYLCGISSFKPLLLSSGLDVTSLYLIGESRDLNKQEQAELRRRSLMLVMYLLRSPLYDCYTKKKLLGLLRGLANTVPGISIILVPLMEYLPVWQKIYFYTWST